MSAEADIAAWAKRWQEKYEYVTGLQRRWFMSGYMPWLPPSTQAKQGEDVSKSHSSAQMKAFAEDDKGEMVEVAVKEMPILEPAVPDPTINLEQVSQFDVSNLPLPIIHKDLVLEAVKKNSPEGKEIQHKLDVLCGFKEIPLEETKVESKERDEMSGAVTLLTEFIENAGQLHPHQFDRLDAVRALLKAKAEAKDPERWLLYWAEGDCWLYSFSMNGYASWSRDLEYAQEYESSQDALAEKDRLKGMEGLTVIPTTTESPRKNGALNGKAAVAEQVRKEQYTELVEKEILRNRPKAEPKPFWVLYDGGSQFWNGECGKSYWNCDIKDAKRYGSEQEADEVSKTKQGWHGVKAVQYREDEGGELVKVQAERAEKKEEPKGEFFWVIKEDRFYVRHGHNFDDKKHAMRFKTREEAGEHYKKCAFSSSRVWKCKDVGGTLTPVHDEGKPGAWTPEPVTVAKVEEKVKKYRIRCGVNRWISNTPERYKKDNRKWMYTSNGNEVDVCGTKIKPVEYDTREAAEVDLKRIPTDFGGYDHSACVEEIEVASVKVEEKVKKYVIRLHDNPHYICKPYYSQNWAWVSTGPNHRDHPALRYETRQEAEAALKRVSAECNWGKSTLDPEKARVEEVDS